MDPVQLTTALLVAAAGLPAGRAVDVLAHRVTAQRTRPTPASAPAVTPAVTPASTPGPAVGPPWVELGTAVLLLGVVLRVGVVPALGAWLWFVLGAVLLTVVDLRHLVLPNRVLAPWAAGAAVLLTVAAAATGAWADLGRALVAALVVALGLLVLALVNPAGLGMGDVKLGLVLGWYLGWLGWPSVLVGILLGAVAQAVVGLALLATRRAGRRTALPFGPALLGGVLAVLLLAGG